jgi:hypothetical protein
MSSWDSSLSVQCCFIWRGPIRALQLILFGTKAHLLPRSRPPYAIPNCRGTFFHARARNIAIFHRRNFDVEIDAIKRWSGNSPPITLDLERPATAVAFQIAKLSARARVHLRHEHELGTERDAARTREMVCLTRLVRPSVMGGKR